MTPTETGYYWFQPYNPTTGLADGPLEIVYVAMQVMFRRKLTNRVIGKFWSCNLNEVINAKWSARIPEPTL